MKHLGTIFVGLILVTGVLSLSPKVRTHAFVKWMQLKSGGSYLLDERCYSVPSGFFINDGQSDADSKTIHLQRIVADGDYEFVSLSYLPKSDLPVYVQEKQLEMGEGGLRVFELEGLDEANASRYWAYDEASSILLIGTSESSIIKASNTVRDASCDRN